MVVVLRRWRISRSLYQTGYVTNLTDVRKLKLYLIVLNITSPCTSQMSFDVAGKREPFLKSPHIQSDSRLPLSLPRSLVF